MLNREVESCLDAAKDADQWLCGVCSIGPREALFDFVVCAKTEADDLHRV